MQMKHRRSHLWFHYLCASEGVISLIALLSIPTEGGTVSPARLGLIGILLVLITLWIYLGFRQPKGFDLWLARPASIRLLALLSLTFSLLLFLLRYLDPERLLPLFERLSPLLWYLLLLSVQFALFLLYLKYGFHFESLKTRKRVYIASLVALFILFVALLFVSITKLGITKDSAYWGEPGVPILGWQLVLSVLVGAGFLLYEFALAPHFASRPLNLVLPLSIWFIACALWLSVPISSLRNSFYAPITPPYKTPFPYSDAGFYDYLAQSLLIGTDYLQNIPPRPLYVSFLAALHLLFGQDYLRIIAAQTLALALFPVALYWLGARLHSRAAGVTIAFFAIFRELTTLWISSNTRTASSKMFVTDLPTAMGIAFVCLVAVRWLERRDARSALLAGGVFGLLLLLRTQSLIVLPVLFVLAWLVHQRRVREWAVAGFAFGIAMILTVTPWLIHNYGVTGRVAFDDPAQMAAIYSQYSFDENLDISRFDFGSESLGRRLLTFTLENPGFVGGFIANHFLDTEIGGLLALPLIERFDGLLAPVNLYWITWDGRLEPYNLLLIVIYLGVIAVGFGAAWNRHKWIGLTPLAFNLGYALANGISRFSSWRYNLPVDWVPYFYFGIGVIEILGWVAILFGADASKMHPLRKVESPKASSRASHALLAAGFVFAGSMPWLAKGMAVPRYTSTREGLIERVQAQDLNRNPLDSFLSQPGAQIEEGKLLYPRFYRRGDGIFSAHPWPAYAAREYARLGFILLNEGSLQVIFPAREPYAFPHGADAIVLGCAREDHLEARWIFFPQTNETYFSAPLTEPCAP